VVNFSAHEKPKKSHKAKQFVKANKLELMPQSQIIFFKPTNVKRG